MKVAIVVFPGSNCDRDIAWAIKKISGYKPDYLWHKEKKNIEKMCEDVLTNSLTEKYKIKFLKNK